VGVVGAGFSGSLIALHLLRLGPPELRVFLIERAGGFGPGLAYGTQNPQHLLNVRVGNMSAYPDQPRHLEQWLRDAGHDDVAHPGAFITRGTYGRYLMALVREAVAGSDGAHRLVLVRDEAVAAERGPGGVRLRLAMGRTLEVDAAVVATGHPTQPPAADAGLERLPAGVYAPDPWAPGALADLAEGAPVLILGTGLTMVDVALAIEAKGAAGPIFALSRRGLAPRRHSGDFTPIPSQTSAVVAAPLSQRLRCFRSRARAIGWRQAVDEIRPAARSIWRAASADQRRRFLRHLRPWWDVHRHRMAPQVAEQIADLRERGGLTVAAGRLLRAQADGEGAIVTWRPRGEARAQALRVGRIINCTGPDGGPAQMRHPLIQSLIAGSWARPDSLGLGLDIDEDGRLVGAGGRPDPRLWAVGPITRGAFWEVTAVPDIRNQVAAAAKSLAAELAGAGAIVGR
jgi:uncharacterized NAD(P)/FAD-binding protein YdhS